MDKVVPHPHLFVVQLGQAALGIIISGLGIALYLSAHLGPGPRDGVMTSLHQRLGWPIARVRLTLETLALIAGIALGGRFGIGTIMFGLAVGHCFGLWLTVLGNLDPKSVMAA